MLIVNSLTKTYDKTVAVNNISFEVKSGEIAILLGPNGAGKSTTIKCIAGLLRYIGTIEMGGYPNKSSDAKKIFSYVPETPVLYEMLTVYEHMEFISNAYRIENSKEKIETILERFELADKKDKLGKELSKGMQQKVSICCGLLTNPKVILFDEPMIGLDPKAIKELKDCFVELKSAGCAVIISTHIIDSIDEIWDKVLIMDEGNVVMSSERSELEKSGETLEQIFFRVTEG